MKTAAIVQVRLDSTRLPKKALSDILGKPMTLRLLERLSQAKKIDSIIVATTDRPIDDEIADIVSDKGFIVFRGDSDDVLDRYYNAALKHNIDVIVRITGDCPLIEPDVVDMIVKVFEDNGFDYVSNTIKPTFPDGICVEVFSFDAIKKAWEDASLKSEREHVTPFIRTRPEIFKLKNIENKVDLSDLRWTVDEPEDLIFVREIFKRLYNSERIFHIEDILKLLKKHPELKEINSGIGRNEGYIRSLKEDKIIDKKVDKNE